MFFSSSGWPLILLFLLQTSAVQYHTFLIEYVRANVRDPEPHYCLLYRTGQENWPPTLKDAFDSDRQALFDYAHPLKLSLIGLLFENGREILVPLLPGHELSEELPAPVGAAGAPLAEPAVYRIEYNYVLGEGWPTWPKRNSSKRRDCSERTS